MSTPEHVRDRRRRPGRRQGRGRRFARKASTAASSSSAASRSGRTIGPPLSKEYLRGEADSRAASGPTSRRSTATQEIELRLATAVSRSTPGARGRARRRRAHLVRAAAARDRRRAAQSRRCRAPSSTASTTCARIADSDAHRRRASKRREARRGHRRRLDRLRGRRIGAPAGLRGHARSRRPRCRSRSVLGMRARRGLPRRPSPTTASILRLESDDRAASRATAPSSGCTLGRRRSVECDVVVAGIGATPRVGLAQEAGHRRRQRRPRRRAAADERRRTSSQPATSRTPCTRSSAAPHPRRALGERPRSGPGGRRAMLGADDLLRRDPVLLLRPVRRRHGVRGLSRGADELVLPRRPRESRVHRVLARGDRIVAA